MGISVSSSNAYSLFVFFRGWCLCFCAIGGNAIVLLYRDSWVIGVFTISPQQGGHA